MDRAISALSPRLVRDTAMFAMFTPPRRTASDLADHAGHVVVAEEGHQRGDFHLELEAEGADEPEAVLAPDRRPGDAKLVSVRTERDADQVREVAREGASFLDDLHAALRRDHRRVHIVDGLVGRPWKAPFSAATVSRRVS